MTDIPQLREVWRITSEGDGGPKEYERDSVDAVLRIVRAELVARATLIKIERKAA